MIKTLICKRCRMPFLSRAWTRQWLKRGMLSGKLFQQFLAHRHLTRHGAQISPTSYIADARSITGNHTEHLTVGHNTFIGRCTVTLNSRVTIGDFVCINDGVIILTASHDVTTASWNSIAAPVFVGNYAWIATNAIILPGVRIGTGAVVGAGAVVTKDIPDFGIAVGNPARLLEKKRAVHLNYNPVRHLAVYEAWLGPPHGALTSKHTHDDHDSHEPSKS